MNKEERLITASLMLPKRQIKYLEEEAAKQDRSRSWVLREIIDKEMSQKKTKGGK